MSVINLNEANFETEVLGSDKPVLVDFYADWCGPCAAMAPVIDELVQDVADTAYVYKMNVDGCTRITSALRIMSIPTFVVFKEGEAVDLAMGTPPVDFLKGMLA